MYYAGLNTHDSANGPGFRVTLFVSGCPHHCFNCFNEEAWAYDYGQSYTEDVKQQVLDACGREYIQGLTLLGGEPLAPANLSEVKALCEAFKQRYPSKNIWMWTGYVYDKLTPQQKAVAELVDVLVDGPFVNELKDLSLKFRGSSNQRILINHNGTFTVEV